MAKVSGNWEDSGQKTGISFLVTYRVPAMKTIVFVEGRRFAVLLTATLAARGFRVAKLTSYAPTFVHQIYINQLDLFLATAHWRDV
jgi:hypothetical protein